MQTQLNSNVLRMDRPLPSNIEAERCVLGAVLIEERLLSTVAEMLIPKDFYSPIHRTIYSVMLSLFEKRKAIDPINIGEELKKEDVDPESIGGLATIANLTFGLPMRSLRSADEIRDYCRIVQEKRRVRDLIHTCSQIQREAADETEDTIDVLQNAQAAINQVCTSDARRSFKTLGELSAVSMTRINELRSGTRKAGGLLTGLRHLDFVTSGLQPSDFVVFAARPGMGKSSLAGQIALNTCVHNPGVVVAIFSLEMNERQYTDRLLATKASVNLTRMRQGSLNSEEMWRLERASEGFNDLGFVIDDSSSISGVEIRSKLLRLKHERGRLDLVIVDYLQRMVTAKKTDGRQQEVSRVAQDLKSIAKDFDIPVVALSSLNRACESRNPPIPRMSDLRESGDIESEADLVAFIYRAHYYDNNKNPRLAEFIIDKHRNGPTETIQLNFIGEFTQFGDYDG